MGIDFNKSLPESKKEQSQMVFDFQQSLDEIKINQNRIDEMFIDMFCQSLDALEINDIEKNDLRSLARENLKEAQKTLHDMMVDKINQQKNVSAQATIKVSTTITARATVEFGNKGILTILPEKDKSLDLMLYIAAFFLSSDIRDVVIGDMTEKYHQSVKRWGTRKAKGLLARDIGISIFPFVWAFARKLILTSFKALGLYKLIKIVIGKLSGF